MADISYSGYESSGYNEASGTAALQAEKAKIPTTDAELRTQAEAQYKDTLNTLDSSLSRQITAMITSQATDEKLLTDAYNKSVSLMSANLQKRGLLNGTLPTAQTNALNKYMNEVKDVRAAIYENQLALPKAQKDLLVTNYDKAIAQRVAANRQTNIPTVSELLQKVYELQSSSFSDYANYLLNSSKKSSGGSYRRSSGSGSSSSAVSSSYVNVNDLTGYGGGLAVSYYEGTVNRALTNRNSGKSNTSTYSSGLTKVQEDRLTKKLAGKIK